MDTDLSKYFWCKGRQGDNGQGGEISNLKEQILIKDTKIVSRRSYIDPFKPKNIIVVSWEHQNEGINDEARGSAEKQEYCPQLKECTNCQSWKSTWGTFNRKNANYR